MSDLGDHNCEDMEHVSLSCSHEIGIRQAHDNVIEIYQNGEYLPLCDRTFTQHSADVVCKTLGF